MKYIPKRIPLIERLMSKVSPEPNSGCWLWMGSMGRHGYGNISVDVDGVWRTTRVHRASYRLHRGPIPDELGLDHKCRVTLCVNPDHLRPATVKQNTLCGIGPTAINSKKTHCIHGHELYGGNLYVRKNGNRQCRTCKAKELTTRRARLKVIRTSPTREE